MLSVGVVSKMQIFQVVDNTEYLTSSTAFALTAARDNNFNIKCHTVFLQHPSFLFKKIKSARMLQFKYIYNSAKQWIHITYLTY